MQIFITQFKKNKKLYITSTLIWLVLWELLALIINEEILFVSPLKVFSALIRLAGTFDFWKSIAFSVIRVLLGFGIGYIFATLIAVLAFKFAFFKAFVTPAISAIKATPVASFIILALMWAGKNLVPVFICVLMVTPIVWTNVLEGLQKVDKKLLEAAQIYKMSTTSKIKNIYIPTLIPYNAAAISSGLGLCWKAGIAAEVICRTMPSIGNSIWETKFYIVTDEMFAWTLAVILLSVLFDKVLKLLFKRTLKEYKTEAKSDTN
ncbi:MAG: ABC transporter permease subunit [Clostridia bacterium]|nr:ABC transporter permease subunit [Clostridia bacterium]